MAFLPAVRDLVVRFPCQRLLAFPRPSADMSLLIFILYLSISSTNASCDVVTRLLAGLSHTCVLTSGGGLRCWGSNTRGQLNGTTFFTDVFSLPPTDSGSGVLFAAAGGFDTCVILSSGRQVYCCGDNTFHQIGLSLPSTVINFPASSITADAIFIATGGGSSSGATCVVLNTNDAWCWGSLTLAGPTGSALIAADVSAVAIGAAHACLVNLSGSVLCWGANGNGQLGDGTNVDRARVSQAVALSSTVANVTAGDDFMCALLTDGSGTVVCWGANNVGQLGDGTYSDSNVPSRVVLTSVVQISAGSVHTCACLGTGSESVVSVSCWGGNSNGQLGTGGYANVNSPPLTPVLSGVASVVAGGVHTCALMSNGVGIRCWGSNAVGQLGNGNVNGVDVLSPPTTDLTFGSCGPLAPFSNDILPVAAGAGVGGGAAVLIIALVLVLCIRRNQARRVQEVKANPTSTDKVAAISTPTQASPHSIATGSLSGGGSLLRDGSPVKRPSNRVQASSGVEYPRGHSLRTPSRERLPGDIAVTAGNGTLVESKGGSPPRVPITDRLLSPSQAVLGFEARIPILARVDSHSAPQARSEPLPDGPLSPRCLDWVSFVSSTADGLCFICSYSGAPCFVKIAVGSSSKYDAEAEVYTKLDIVGANSRRSPLSGCLVRYWGRVLCAVSPAVLTLCPPDNASVLQQGQARCHVYDHCPASLMDEAGLRYTELRAMFSRLAEIATALSSARLIHRNFTLRHFRYDSNNRIVLSGLGYTLFVPEDGPRVLMLSGSNIRGSKSATSPEVLAATRVFLDAPRSPPRPVDFTGQPVFEFGVLLWKLVTGRHPLWGYPDSYSTGEGASFAISYEDSLAARSSLDETSSLFRRGYPPTFEKCIRAMLCCNPSARPSLPEAIASFPH